MSGPLFGPGPGVVTPGTPPPPLDGPVHNTFQYSQHISIFTTLFNIHNTFSNILTETSLFVFRMNAQHSKTKMAENEELDLQHDHESFYCGYCSQCGTQIERKYIFCPQCGVNIERGYLSHTLTLGNHSLSEREIIESYFYSGFEYESILQFLSKFTVFCTEQ